MCVVISAASALAATSSTAGRATSVNATGRLIFASSRAGGDLQLYVAEATKDAEEKLFGSGLIGFNPKWAPHGDRIAFVRDEDIHVVASSGKGAVRNLTNHAKTDINPSWSPDGTQLAFASNRAGNFEIYVLRLDRNQLVRLTTTPGLERYPAWSPDGEQIAFQRDGAILAMKARDGSRVITLAARPPNDGENVSPAWSPDGQRIAFASKRRPHPTNAEIYVMSRSNWRRQTRLTEDTGKPFSDTDPTWSPDGETIVFTSTRGDNGYDIFSIAADGGSGSIVQLTTDPAQDTTADWWPEFSTSSAMRRRVESGILRIRSRGECPQDGTGFVVGDRLIVTANHVVRGASRIALYQGAEQIGTATIVGRDLRSDVALLRSSTRLHGYRFRLSARRVEVDARVSVLGYRGGGARTRRDTRVEATNETSDGADGGTIAGLLRLTEFLEQGNSGSPVLVSPESEFGRVDPGAGDVAGLVIRRGSRTASYALPAGRFRGKILRWQSAAPLPRQLCS